MQVILKKLEDSISEQCYIDIEMNSLEDAYINIAKEEEKLLADLRQSAVINVDKTKHNVGIHPHDVQANEQKLKRYMETKGTHTFIG